MAIRTNTLHSLIPFVKRMHRNGIGLEPMSNSILGHLNNATPNFQFALNLAVQAAHADGAEPTEETLFSELVNHISAASTEKDVGGLYPHDIAMEKAIAEGTRIVEAVLDHTRNVVNPLINQLVEETQARFIGMAAQTVRPVNVIVDGYPSIWHSPVLHLLVENFNGTPAIQFVKKPVFQEVSGEQLATWIKTGNGEFDMELEGFIKDLPEGFLTKAIGSAFFPNTGEFDLENFYSNDAASRNAYIVVYLAARRLLAETPEGALVDAEEYRSHLTSVMAEMGRRINACLDARESDNRGKVLIRSYGFWDPTSNMGNTEILVNGDVYDQWVKEGGDNTVLFGACISDRERSYDKLLENASDYREAWGRQERITTLRFEANQSLVARESVGYVFALHVQTLPEAERATLNVNSNLVLASIDDSEVKDFHRTMRALVCRVLFPQTDCEQILTEMDKYGKANPSADPREACLAALFVYVPRWAAANIKKC